MTTRNIQFERTAQNGGKEGKHRVTFAEEQEHFGSEDDAVREATTLTYDRVLDAVIGTAAGVTGITSFDNYAHAGVIEQTTVTAQELEEVDKSSDSFIGGFGGSDSVPTGPLYKVPTSLKYGVQHGYVLAHRGDLIKGAPKY